MAHRKHLLRVVAVLAAGAAVMGVLYGKNLVGMFQHEHAAQSAGGERKVLFWYDAMNPQNHYNKPGKAPDGMDLVPKYADEDAGKENRFSPSTVRIWFQPSRSI